jgi:hypothetical protein
MGSSSALWKDELRRELNFPTHAQLRETSDERIVEAALRVGWQERGATTKVMFSPGALRRWFLSLPVVRADHVGMDHLSELHDSRGFRFAQAKRACQFIRARLAGAPTRGSSAESICLTDLVL